MTRRIDSPWGTITPIATKAGVVRYRLRGYVDGKLESFGVYDSPELAQGAALAALRKLESRSQGLTVAGWISRCLALRERAGRHRAVDSSRQVLEQHVSGSKLGGMLVRQVKPTHVRKLLHDVAAKRATKGRRKGEPLARNTVRNVLRELSSCLADAVDHGKMPANPCVGVRVPKEAPRTDDPFTYLSADERRVLLDAEGDIPLKPWSVFVLAVYTGMRLGEIVGLRWEDVRDLDGDDPHLVVSRSYNGPTKGNRVRRVELVTGAVRVLQRWRDAGGTRFMTHVFPWVTGGTKRSPRVRVRLHGKGYDFQWAEVWRSHLGVSEDVTFRSFRRTCGVCLISGSWGRVWSLREVQAQLGHKSLTTTEKHYARFEPGRMRDVAREARAEWDG